MTEVEFRERLLMSLEELNVNLRQVTLVLAGQVPRFHVIDPEPDLTARLQAYFAEVPPGSIKAVDQETSDALSQVKKL